MPDPSELTRREAEIYNIVERMGRRGCTVRHVADERDISYPAAYEHMENLKDKGFVSERWAPKGNRKSYEPAPLD